MTPENNNAQVVGAAPKRGVSRLWLPLRALSACTERERRFLLSELGEVKGLLPLLMKPRNNQPWTTEDKTELARHLRRLSDLSPYLVVVVMPGGFFMLPALAWWLDRRRKRRPGASAR